MCTNGKSIPHATIVTNSEGNYYRGKAYYLQSMSSEKGFAKRLYDGIVGMDRVYQMLLVIGVVTILSLVGIQLSEGYNPIQTGLGVIWGLLLLLLAYVVWKYDD